MVRAREHFLGYVAPPYPRACRFVLSDSGQSAATRGAILRYRYLDDSTPKDRRHVSTFAGALTGGTIGGLISKYDRIYPPGRVLLSLSYHSQFHTCPSFLKFI